MADYTGSDRRLAYLFANGGGGGGSCKVISGYYHNGYFYEDQSYTQIITGDTECLYIDLDTTTLYLFDGTDYVEVQGGGGGDSFACDLLLENTDFSIASGSATSERQYTLSASIENYDGVLVIGFTNVSANERNQAVSMIVLKSDYSIGSSNRWTYLLNGSIPTNNRRLAFGFSDSTTIQTAASRVQNEEPRLYRVYGLNFGGSLHTYSTTEQVVGTWIDGKPIYEVTIDCGTLANTTSTQYFNHGISDLEMVIDTQAFMTNGSASANLPFYWTASDGVSIWIELTRIGIVTQSNRSSYRAYVTLRYTKSTT